MARRQIPDLADPQRIQVPGAVTDLFGGAPRPVIDNNLGQLADALGAFNSSLTRLGGAMALNSKVKNQEEQGAAQQWLLTHNSDEIKGAVENGTIPIYQDPVANSVIAKGAGKLYGGLVRNSVNQGLLDGSINLLDPKTNIDQIVTDHAKDAVALLGQKFGPQYSKAVTAGIAGELGPLREGLVAKQQQQLVEQNVHDRLQTFNSALDGIIQQHGATLPDGSVDPADVDKAVSDLRSAKGELGKSLAITGSSLPYKWMDQQLVSVLKNNAKTHPEIVFKALTDQRTDQNGNPLPALIDNPAYAKEARQIIQDTQTAMAGKLHGIMLNQQVDKAIGSIERGDGSIWTGHDMTYFNKFTKKYDTIPWDTVKSQALSRWQTASDTQAQQTNESADAKFDREYQVYHQANQPWPRVKDTLEGVAAAMSNPAAISNPDFANKAKAAGELYMKMGGLDYNYLKSTIKLPERGEQFYQTYEMARRYLGQNTDQALSTASAVVSAPGGLTGGNVDSDRVQKQIADKISSDFSDGSQSHWWNPLSWGGANPSNAGAVQRQVTEIAKMFARVPGMKAEDAATTAEQWVKDHSTIINGHVVVGQGYMPPKDLQQYVPNALDQFVKQHGDYVGQHDASNLSIIPFGNTGNFRIVDRSGAVPQQLFVLDGKGNATPAVIKMQDLLKTRENAIKSGQATLDQNTIKMQNAHTPTFMQTSPNTKKMSDDTAAALSGVMGKLGVSPEALDHYWGVANDKVKRLFGITP